MLRKAFRKQLTIASTTLTHFRTNYLPQMDARTFPRVHPDGYFPQNMQSEIGVKWLKYMAKKNNIPLDQLQFSETGEYDWLVALKNYDYR